MVVFPKTGEKLMIYNDDFGLFREGTIHTINGSEIEITFQDGIQKFFIDINSKLLFNSEGTFHYENLVDMELMTLLLDRRTVDQTVKRLINFVPSECRCINCIANELEFLSLSTASPPTQNNTYGFIIKLYIETMMIPQRFAELRLNLLGTNIHDVLQRSFDEQQIQNKCISDKNLQKILGSKMIFDKTKYASDCSCMFCLEEFSEMKTPSIIECPNCQATFCPGSDNFSNECCKGLRYHLKNDNRCPVCRISATDWVKKLDDIPKKIIPVVYKTDLSIEDLIEKPVSKKKMYQIQPDKFVPKKIKKSRYYHRGYSRRQIYGKMR